MKLRTLEEYSETLLRIFNTIHKLLTGRHTPLAIDIGAAVWQ